MKNIFYISLLIFQISLAQNAFDEGNKYYEKENYRAAISKFESLIQSNKQSSELYFNLANCYYKLHKVAPAIYNYEKALLLSPNDLEIKTNLEFAKKMAVDDIKVIPKVGFNKLVSDFTSKYHFDSWACMSIGFSFVMLLFFIGYYFSNKTILKRIFFIGMFFWLVGILFCVAAGFYEKTRIEKEKPAIVFSEMTPLKSEPKPNAQEITQLHEGSKVYIIESVANWRKVTLTDETSGWIAENAIREIKE